MDEVIKFKYFWEYYFCFRKVSLQGREQLKSKNAVDNCNDLIPVSAGMLDFLHLTCD